MLFVILLKLFFSLQFANEFPSRIAPLLRMPVVVDMSPRERQAADLYIDEVRELFADWQASKGQDPS